MATVYAALDGSGAPYQITPGATFDTHWQLILNDQEAAWTGVAVGQLAPVQVGHPADFNFADNAALARFGIQKLTVADPPTGEFMSGVSLSVSGGVIAATPAYATIPVPQQVTRGQAKQALLNAGLLTSVNSAVAAASQELQIYWNDFPTFHRQHPQLLALATQLNLTSDQVDTLFRQAALIT